MFRIFILSVLMLNLFPGFSQTDTLVTKTLTSEQIQKDFQYLKRILTETHPGIYRYTSKESMTHKMDSLYQLLDKPMKFYDSYLILSYLVASIRCAHTYLTPTKSIQSFFTRNTKTFPFNISFPENKYYISVNGTERTDIKPGFELLSINGKSMASVRAYMQKLLWADGYNEIFKNKATEEGYFPLFYYLLVERPESFEVVYKDDNGKEQHVTIAAQPFKETLRNFKRNKVNHPIMRFADRRNKLDSKRGWRLTIRKDDHVGVMRIAGFGGEKK